MKFYVKRLPVWLVWMQLNCQSQFIQSEFSESSANTLTALTMPDHRISAIATHGLSTACYNQPKHTARSTTHSSKDIFNPSYTTTIYTTYTANKALYRHFRWISVTPLHNENEWHRTKVQPSLRLPPSPSHYWGRCCTNEYKPPSCIRGTRIGWKENQCLLSEVVGTDILSLNILKNTA